MGVLPIGTEIAHRLNLFATLVAKQDTSLWTVHNAEQERVVERVVEVVVPIEAAGPKEKTGTPGVPRGRTKSAHVRR